VKGNDMRIVFGFVLLLGIALAGGAVYLARDYIGEYSAALEQERAARAAMVPTVEVFVVNRQMAYGDKLRKEDVRIVRWPEDAIPEGAFLSGAELFPGEEGKLRTILRRMEKDEAVLNVKVTEPGRDAGITSRLGRGMRAFAIKVDVSSGVSGFLRPDDQVDIYWSGRSRDQDVTKLIQAGVRIVAIDQTADAERSRATIARTITVAISPQQVAALAQAQSTGRLSLSLVGAGDDTVSNAAIEIDQNQLLGIVEEQVVEVTQEEVCTIKTRRGAEVVEIPIDCNESN
jgi:pilus assembly protein CpaB